ncbi:class I SAM-dependent methyltransferase [Streptomyces sp. NBC_01261]|uniref:class I SAM-dependent methyltransferase n=1 Tax=unclassified Streptomyces TaxID=2593676 RepID=UPI002E2D6A41|nr:MULTISPECIES: class I SAM-dependent methyltransferase [unclassified Streptomyces]
MSIQSVVKKVVKPVVGERGWQALRRVKRKAVGNNRPKAPVAPPKPTGVAAISDDLCKLAAHFKTDKWGAHKYAQHYQRYLQHLRGEEFNLLEIGIGGYNRAGEGGASLRMWKHFFPQAQIYGMDIQDKSFVDEDRITTFIGDQSDPESLLSIQEKIGRLDVIIDDGSHRSPHVVTTFHTLFPLLSDGGIYVVEDTQSSYWPEWLGSEDRESPDTSMGMLKRLTDGLNYEEFVDDDYKPTYFDLNIRAVHFFHNLVIIEKGANAEGTNKKRALKDRYGTSPASTS